MLQGETFNDIVTFIYWLKNISSRSVSLIFKSTLSGLKQFLAAESPSKMIKNVFYFILKALLVYKVFNFLS